MSQTDVVEIFYLFCCNLFKKLINFIYFSIFISWYLAEIKLTRTFQWKKDESWIQICYYILEYFVLIQNMFWCSQQAVRILNTCSHDILQLENCVQHDNILNVYDDVLFGKKTFYFPPFGGPKLVFDRNNSVSQFSPGNAGFSSSLNIWMMEVGKIRWKLVKKSEKKVKKRGKRILTKYPL